MGLLSTSVSITQYQVKGTLESVLDTVGKGLKKNSIQEIDDDVSDSAIGWTSIDHPFKPDFETSSFTFGIYLVFSLRIDKKSIPVKVLNKYCALEADKMLSENGRNYLNRNEKRMIKDRVYTQLLKRYPATPSIYDVIWNYEAGTLWFFSNQKRPNEELETLFSKSFHLNLIRIFPFTAADLTMDLKEKERDILIQLSPTQFSE
jgi:recombination associated protein RdgC